MTESNFFEIIREERNATIAPVDHLSSNTATLMMPVAILQHRLMRNQPGSCLSDRTGGITDTCNSLRISHI